MTDYKYGYSYPPPGSYQVPPPVMAPPQYYAEPPPPKREPSFLEGLYVLCNHSSHPDLENPVGSMESDMVVLFLVYHFAALQLCVVAVSWMTAAATPL
ncbi:Uncharacterized protein TCM_007311 [Theobroma cacao]|uniref:Uncharacterized protein n=1 Tax=Theobroma cacao TaxID=3641 RepID=A0A061E0V9_THECC|nr:Uncharacterized protein TCM_007311 [Theobroma cacao]